VVLEAELYQTEGQSWQDVIQILGQQQVPGLAGGTATLAELPSVGYRITFADAILLA
jgi:hypothetical protein